MKNPITKTHSRGIALVSGMILLLLSSIVAVSSLKAALLETRVAQRHSEHALLIQQTESALLYAESNLLPASQDISPNLANGNETHHTIPFSSLTTSIENQNLFTPSIANISPLYLPGSKVRGRDPVNSQSSLEFFKVEATTNFRDGNQGVRITSTVVRGSH